MTAQVENFQFLLDVNDDDDECCGDCPADVADGPVIDPVQQLGVDICSDRDTRSGPATAQRASPATWSSL